MADQPESGSSARNFDARASDRPTGGQIGGRHALTFIFITVLIDMTGLGIIAPVMPQLIEDLTGRGASDAAVVGGLLYSVYALMQFVAAPVVGGLSDRFGRRPVLLFSLAGFSIDYLIMGLAPVLWLLFIGRAASGVFGATITTAGAYIADVSPPEKRAQNFGLLYAGFGVGFIIGPMIGGFLGEIDPRAPFYAASALALSNLIYGFFVLPETLKRENRRAFSWARANPLGSLLSIRRYPAVLGLLAAVFLFQLAHQVYPSVWSYYTIERYGWSERHIGFSLGVVGIVTVIAQGGLTRVIIPRLGDARTVVMGLSLTALIYAGYGLSSAGWMLYIFIVIGGLAGLASPAMQSIMTSRIPPDGQGELQGAVASLTSLASLLAPIPLTSLFGHFSGADAKVYLPGIPFFAAAGLALTGFALAARALAAGGAAARESA